MLSSRAPPHVLLIHSTSVDSADLPGGFVVGVQACLMRKGRKEKGVDRVCEQSKF